MLDRVGFADMFTDVIDLSDAIYAANRVQPTELSTAAQEVEQFDVELEAALSVYRGVVRAAYRIEGWEPAPAEEMKADTRVVGRRGFWGTPAVDVLERYGFGDVTSMLPQVAQNPLRYVNCGS